MFGEVSDSILFFQYFEDGFNSTSEEFWHKYKNNCTLFCYYSNRNVKRMLDSCNSSDDRWLKEWMRKV